MAALNRGFSRRTLYPERIRASPKTTVDRENEVNDEGPYKINILSYTIFTTSLQIKIFLNKFDIVLRT